MVPDEIRMAAQGRSRRIVGTLSKHLRRLGGGGHGRAGVG